MLIEMRGPTLFIDGRPHIGRRGKLFRADTGEKIWFPQYANTDTGEWRAIAVTPDGKIARPARIISGCCPIRFELSESFHEAEPSPVAPLPKTTPILTPIDQVKEFHAIARDTINGYKPMLAVPGIECEEPKCHRLATWQVSYEQEIEPGKMADGSPCERAVTVKVKKWCSWHFRPGTTVDQRGVEFEHHDIVRPQ